MIPLTKPYFPERDILLIKKEIEDILKDGRLILGKYTRRFEKSFAEYTGTRYAIALNSCTSSLVTSLRYININKKEVIVPSNTFIATPNSVMSAGGKVVFADIKKDTMCLDTTSIKKNITKRTKAVILVHSLGLICPEIGDIVNVCKQNNLILLEDAAHAHGASYRGQKAGSIGKMGCFSFYATKVMTTMVGGMITTNQKGLMEFAKSMRFFGSGKSLNEIVREGNDWIMGEINSVLGFYQLKRLDQNVKRRNKIAEAYNESFRDMSNIKLFETPNGAIHSFYKYPLLLSEKINRDKLIMKLKKKYGIESSIVYVPCHNQPYYTKKFYPKTWSLPITEDVLNRTICLPVFVQLSEKQQQYIIKSFREVVKHGK